MMPEYRHLAARKAPSRRRLAQLVSVVTHRALLHFAVLAVIVQQIRGTAAAVAVEIERRIGDDVEHLRAAERFLVQRRESLEAVASAVFAEARTLEDAVLGEAIDPLFEAAGVDRQAIARVQYANFLAVFDCSGYRHRINSL